MPTESGITLPPDGTGKSTRTNTVSTAFGTVHMHVQVIGDPNTPANQAGVDSVGRLRVVQAEDIGRMPVVLYTAALAGVTTEALATFSQNKAGVVTSGSSYTVTSGKTLRINQITVTVRSSAAAVGWARIAVRSAYTSAAPSATSPIFWVGETSTNGATANFGGQVTATIADGLEFPSGTVIGISHVASATTVLETITLIGFEY
jgi:hypothetical protein